MSFIVVIKALNAVVLCAECFENKYYYKLINSTWNFRLLIEQDKNMPSKPRKCNANINYKVESKIYLKLSIDY